jgi:DNA-binding GntR family transcriptional regulator
MGLASRSLTASAGGVHRTLADHAFAAIHSAILSGELEPGERLPIEDLAELLGMSPMPVREALRRLDSVGLVEMIAHRGARVAELSVAELRELYEARTELEALAVRLAAERMPASVRRELPAKAARLIGRLGAEAGIDRAAAHAELHFALYDAAGSRWLLRLLTPLWESSERYRAVLEGQGIVLDVRNTEHEELVAAVVGGHAAEAAVAMRRHLEAQADEMARALQRLPAFGPASESA